MSTDVAEHTSEKLRQKTFDRAINLLTYRARSVEEMRERLLEKEWADRGIVDQVIEKLLAYGYLNDQDFARDFASARLRQKPIGKRLLQQKLSLKKLDREVVRQAVENCFQETSESDLIQRAIDRRVRTRGEPRTREDVKKLFDYLMRQGFSSSLVAEKLRTIRCS